MAPSHVFLADVNNNCGDDDVEDDSFDDDDGEEDDCNADEVDGYPVAPNHVFLAECLRIRAMTTSC